MARGKRRRVPRTVSGRGSGRRASAQDIRRAEKETRGPNPAPGVACQDRAVEPVPRCEDGNRRSDGFIGSADQVPTRLGRVAEGHRPNYFRPAIRAGVLICFHKCMPPCRFSPSRSASRHGWVAARKRLAAPKDEADTRNQRDVCKPGIDQLRCQVSTSSTGLRSDGGIFGPRPKRTTKSGLRPPTPRKAANCGLSADTSTG